jgi:hypothetical protein
VALTMTTIVDHWIDGKRLHVIGILVASGNYPAGGDAIPFNNPLIKTGMAPTWIEAQGMGGFNYIGVPGAFLSSPPNAKLRCITSSTGVEVAAGAYPAGITANPIQFRAIFPRG